MYSFTYWRTLWFLSSFTNYKQSCEKTFIFRFLCGHMFPALFSKIPRIIISGLYDKTMFHFGKNLNCLPEWLYHFAFPPAMNKSSYCSHLYLHWVLSVFQILAILIDVYWYLIVLICISVMTYVEGHHFIYLFAIFFYWRLITLQYCSGFCQTLTWISHGSTCVPHPEAPCHVPPHPIPQGHPSAPFEYLLWWRFSPFFKWIHDFSKWSSLNRPWFLILTLHSYKLLLE